jgi:hypothetical protein
LDQFVVSITIANRDMVPVMVGHADTVLWHRNTTSRQHESWGLYHQTSQVTAIVHELLHFSVPNDGKLWKLLMRVDFGNYEHLEVPLRKVAARISVAASL